MSLEIQTDGVRRAVVDDNGNVLARSSAESSSIAVCLHPTPWPSNSDRTCGTPIQRSASGDLLDGVRAHYSYVHPERNIR